MVKSITITTRALLQGGEGYSRRAASACGGLTVPCSLRGEDIQQLKAGPPGKSVGDWAASIGGQMADVPHVQRCRLSLGPKEKLWGSVPAGGRDKERVKVSEKESGLHRWD